MPDLKKAVLTTTIVLLGGTLYLALNWIPILGPLITGFLAGYLLKGNPKEGFNAGLYSAILGVIALALLINTTGLFNTAVNGTLVVLLTIWILTVWNLIGILLSGIGGMLGSIAGQGKRMVERIMPRIGTLPFSMSFGMPKPKRVLRLTPPPDGQMTAEIPEKEGRLKFNICPHCGSSNLEIEKKCGNCGKKL